MLGHPLDDVVGRPLTDFVTIASTLVLSDQLLVVADGPGRVSFEVEMLAADGTTRPTSLTIVDMVDDGAVDGLVATATDITELVAARERLRHAATHDELTGLPNRTAVAQHIRAAISDRSGTPLGIVVLDIDGFAEINDRHGHLVGDGVLVEVASRLHDATGGRGLIGRLGSDEFVVVYPASTDDAVERVVDMVHAAVAGRDHGRPDRRQRAGPCGGHGGDGPRSTGGRGRRGPGPPRRVDASSEGPPPTSAMRWSGGLATVLDVITYTVFDPDDGSGITYRWYGADDTTVYVHNHAAEIDAFGLGEGVVPSVESVAAAVEARHGAKSEYHDEPDDSPVDLGLDLALDPEVD